MMIPPPQSVAPAGDIMADRTRVHVGTVDLRRIGESAL
jgi:hypothetical protein